MLFFGVLLAIGAEISAFVLVAEQIGFFRALVGLLLVSALGPFVIRRVGLGVWTSLQGRVARGEVPTRELLDGVVVLIAGLLICIPGFIGDALGLLLMIGPVRHFVIRTSGHHLTRRVRGLRTGRVLMTSARERRPYPDAPPSTGVPTPPLGPGSPD